MIHLSGVFSRRSSRRDPCADVHRLHKRAGIAKRLAFFERCDARSCNVLGRDGFFEHRRALFHSGGLLKAGRSETGTERRHRDAGIFHFLRDRLGEAAHERFGGVIYRHTRSGAESREGGKVQNLSVSLLDHTPEGSSA